MHTFNTPLLQSTVLSQAINTDSSATYYGRQVSNGHINGQKLFMILIYFINSQFLKISELEIYTLLVWKDELLPVSYTHLDVYKRQELGSAELMFAL